MANIEEQEPPQENEQLPPSNIQCLPAEVLTIIFRHLDVPGKGRVAQVCHYWHQVSRHQSLWHGVAVKAHLKGNDLSHTRIRTRLISMLSPIEDRGQPAACLPHITHMFFSMSTSAQILENIPCIHFFAQKFKNLVTLSLISHRMGENLQFSDAAIGVLCDNLKFIRHLYLTRILITDRGIAILSGHNSAHEGSPLLETLMLHSCGHLTGQSLLYMSSLRRLQHLEFVLCTNIFTNKEGFQFLSRLPKLAHLSVINCANVTDAAYKHLARMETLRELYLNINSGGDMGLAHLVDGGSQISSLQLFHSGVSRWSLLNQLTNLQSLTIGHSGITDADLETLSTTSQIQNLHVYNCMNISDDILKHLVKMGSLQVVSLDLCNISDRGLGYLAQGKSGIAYLTIGSILVTNEGMKYLARLENLMGLILINCSKVSEEGLGYLGTNMAQVTQLTVNGINNYNSSMAHYILHHLTGLNYSKLNRLYLHCSEKEMLIRDIIHQKQFVVDNVDFIHLRRKHYRKEQHWQISFRELKYEQEKVN